MKPKRERAFWAWLLAQEAGTRPPAPEGDDGDGRMCGVYLGETDGGGPMSQRQGTLPQWASTLCRADMVRRAAVLRGRQVTALRLAFAGHDAVTRTEAGLKGLDCAVDWGRSLLTEDPLFHSFVHFQLNHLHKIGKVRSSSAGVLYSRKQGRMITSNYRAKGEGVFPSPFRASLYEVHLDSLPEHSQLRRFCAGRPVNVVSLRDASASGHDARSFVYLSSKASLGVFGVLGRGPSSVEDSGFEVESWLLCSTLAALNLAYQGWRMVMINGDDGLPVSKCFLKLAGADLDGIILSSAHTHRLVQVEQSPDDPLPWAETGFWVVDQCGAQSASIEMEGTEEMEPNASLYWATKVDCVDYGGELLIAAICRRYVIDYSEWRDELSEILDRMRAEKLINKTDIASLHSTLYALPVSAWNIARNKSGATISLPWDKRLVVERCTKHALVHAYLAVGHILLGNVPVEDITDEDWEWIFTSDCSEPPTGSRVAPALLQAARQSFRSRYPMYCLVLSQETMTQAVISLLSHIAVFGAHMCPQSICLIRHVSRFLTYHSDHVKPEQSLWALRTTARSVDAEYIASTSWMHTIYQTVQRLSVGRSSMRRDEQKRITGLRFLVLLAHHYDPLSMFGLIPLELVCHIISFITVPDCADQSAHLLVLMDRLFQHELENCMERLACLLWEHNFKKVAEVLSEMPPILHRYRVAIGNVPVLNYTLTRRYLKVMLCALWPICPAFSSYLWTTQLQAKKSMSAYWRKYIWEERAGEGHLGPGETRTRLIVKRTKFTRMFHQQAQYLQNLVARVQKLVAKTKQKRFNLVVRISVCKGRSRWVASLAEELSKLVGPSTGSLSTILAHRLRVDGLAPRQRDVLIHHLKTAIEEKGLDRITDLSFDELKLVTAARHMIARAAGIAGVHVAIIDGDRQARWEMPFNGCPAFSLATIDN